MSNKILNTLGARTLKDTPTITEDDISKLESFLNIVFPKTYKSILLEFGDTIVFDKGAKYQPDFKSPVDGSDGYQDVIQLYGAVNNENGLLHQNKVYREKNGQLPSSVITIGESSGGNQICIELQTGKILFWHHEAYNSSEEFFVISSSFDSFINRLKPDNEENNSISSVVDESESWLNI